MDLSVTMPGKQTDVVEVNDTVSDLMKQWDSQVIAMNANVSWWQFWKSGHPGLVAATKFLFISLDLLVKTIDKTILEGPDKKATVLAAIDKLYDYVIRETVPVWLRPFSGKLKDYFVNVLMSALIEIVVNNYRNGAWRDELKEEVEKIYEEKEEEPKI